MTRKEVESIAVGTLIREYQTGFYADRKPVEKFGRPQRVIEVFHRGMSRKGLAYANIFFAFGDGLRLSATIVEGDPTWQLEGREDEVSAKEFIRRRNLAGATRHRMLIPSREYYPEDDASRDSD
jgi:hypothetical protein